ncbi:GntR family transcriptional regulator [Luteimicrobium sp. DT211]|uniref:GntR family transcriptional regulator n=1 Tax=Luteimicrobium sp. DT211 TaxID=3393412 RepID=UPI003CF1225D
MSAYQQRLSVDPASPTPAFEQLRLQVLADVEEGRLGPGDKLPPIRTLAADLGLAAGTVARAYRELESDGVVVTRRRAGTVVADTALASSTRVRRAAEDFVAVARGAGLDDDAALDAVRGALLGPGTPPVDAQGD